MAAALHLIPEPRSMWSDRARGAFEQNVFAPEYEVDDAMAIDHEAAISEYKEMKTFLQSSNQRQFSPKLYSELPQTPVRELEIEGEMVGPAHPAFKLALHERISLPLDAFKDHPEIYQQIVQILPRDQLMDVKVAWRCNTTQYWHAEVDAAAAGPMATPPLPLKP